MADAFKDLEFIEESENSFDDLGFEEDVKVSKMPQSEAILEGAKQGLTFGFADELAGGTQAGLDKLQRLMHEYTGLVGPSPTQISEQLEAEGFKGDVGPTSTKELYREAREEAREKFKRAEEDQPGATFGGEMAGGFLVPGAAFGKAAKGATGIEKLLKAGAVGVGAGGLAGAGVSEADLTEGESQELLKDASTGALVGGGVSMGLPMAGTTAVKAGKGIGKIAKGASEKFKEIPTIEDILEAYKRGRMGQKVTGGQAFEDIGQETIDFSRRASEQLSETGSEMAKKQQELLRTSGSTFNVGNVVDNLRETSKKITGITTAAERDEKEIRKMAQNITKKYGKSIDKTEMEHVINDLLEGVPSEKHEQYRQRAINLLEKESLRDINAQKAYKVKKALDMAAGVSKRGGEPSVATDEAASLIKGIERELREQLYDPQTGVKGLKEQNELIESFNVAMEELGLEKVNQRLQSAKEKRGLRNALLSIVKGTARETEQSIVARDAVKQLDDILQTANPKLAEELVPKIKDLSTRLDLARKSISSGNLIGQVLSLGGRTITAGNAAGEAHRALIEATPKMLRTVSSKAMEKGTGAAKEVSRILMKAAERDKRGRQALIFGLMQNPAYREVLGATEDDLEKLVNIQAGEPYESGQ